MKNYKFLIYFVIISITGCVAAGVPYTSDPYKKLEYACDLYKNHNRALPADELLVEAINTFKSENDKKGLAISYREYGLFLISDSVSYWQGAFQKFGFHDKTTTSENRYKSAIRYLTNSLKLSNDLKVADIPININFIIGRIYLLNLKDSKDACTYFNASLASYMVFKKSFPNTKVHLPKGYTNYSDFISQVKDQAGCKSV